MEIVVVAISNGDDCKISVIVIVVVLLGDDTIVLRVDIGIFVGNDEDETGVVVGRIGD